MRKKNRRLAAEVLQTQEVSITIEDDEQDFDIRVVKNGPEVNAAVREMLESEITT